MEENIKRLGSKQYRPVEFVSCGKDDIACNHCAFELGKCRGAIWVLGQCYITDGENITKNIYYEELQELAFA